MNLFKFIWGTFFRLFPCPFRVGLMPIGTPGPKSPVLVTCNFYITVRRIIKNLAGTDAWLLVADSKGVNVWCAAGGDAFNTRSVVSAIKTSGIEGRVEHRRIILPPLGAPGIKAREVEKQTGWTVRWGPVRAGDIPRFLREGERRTEAMKRVTYRWQERLDTALGSLFPFFLLGAVGFFLFAPGLLWIYLAAGVFAFFLFFLTCPWLPGKRGLTKVLFLDGFFAILWVGWAAFRVMAGISLGSGPSSDLGSDLGAGLLIAMVLLFIYGTELGGLAPHMGSDLDPFVSRLGIGKIGNLSFAGSVRTNLLRGSLLLTYYPERCVGCRSCEEVCPQGVWKMKEDKRALLQNIAQCTACRACLVQCQGDAIKAEPVPGRPPGNGRSQGQHVCKS